MHSSRRRCRRRTIVEAQNVEYGRADTTHLQFDVYRASHTTAPLPAMDFFNIAVGEQRANDFYANWARFAASRGLVRRRSRSALGARSR
jgi:hypothetical protein